jgi:hypothetical protein
MMLAMSIICRWRGSRGRENWGGSRGREHRGGGPTPELRLPWERQIRRRLEDGSEEGVAVAPPAACSICRRGHRFPGPTAEGVRAMVTRWRGGFGREGERKGDGCGWEGSVGKRGVGDDEWVPRVGTLDEGKK